MEDLCYHATITIPAPAIEDIFNKTAPVSYTAEPKDKYPNRYTVDLFKGQFKIDRYKACVSNVLLNDTLWFDKEAILHDIQECQEFPLTYHFRWTLKKITKILKPSNSTCKIENNVIETLENATRVEAEKNEQNFTIFIIIGVTGGGLAVIGSIFLIIYCCCCRKDTTEKNEEAGDINPVYGVYGIGESDYIEVGHCLIIFKHYFSSFQIKDYNTVYYGQEDDDMHTIVTDMNSCYESSDTPNRKKKINKNIEDTKSTM